MPRTLLVNNKELTKDARYSFLTEDVVADGSTIRIQGLIGFHSLTTASGQVLLLGELGDEKAEIVRTSDSTGPSAAYKQITLRDSLTQDHPQDTRVYIVDWDRVEFSHADTVTGSKTLLFQSPIPIQPDQDETAWKDTILSSGFYFARFNESIDNSDSDYSDAVPYNDYDDNSVYKIKERALQNLGEKIDGVVITDTWLNSCLWQARREYHQARGKRPFRRKFNVDIGNVLTGSARINLPTDAERPYTSRNIYGVRIGTNRNLGYHDKKDHDFWFENIAHSTLELPYTVNTTTSIWLLNGRDFTDSATINVEGAILGLSRITGETNSFKIISHGDYSASAGSDVWENVTLGLPDKFTVWAEPEGSAYIYFNVPFSTAYANKNIYLDYYRTLVGYNSDADILDETEYDMYVHYLMAKIKQRRTKGNTSILKDEDYQLWMSMKEDALSKEFLGQKIRIRPE